MRAGMTDQEVLWECWSAKCERCGKPIAMKNWYAQASFSDLKQGDFAPTNACRCIMTKSKTTNVKPNNARDPLMRELKKLYMSLEEDSRMGEEDLRDMYREDAKDTKIVYELLLQGKYGEAHRFWGHMDTAPRDSLPEGIRWAMRAAESAKIEFSNKPPTHVYRVIQQAVLEEKIRDLEKTLAVTRAEYRKYGGRIPHK